MNKEKLNKLYALGEKNAKYFKWIADPIVRHTTVTDEENMKKVSYLSAVDMAIGAAVKRNEHILTGVGIGVLGTTLAFTIGNIIKNKNKDDMDTNEVSTEKEDIEVAFEEVSVSQPDITEIDEDEDEQVVEAPIKNEKKVDENINIMDKVNDILKKPHNLDDLKAVVEELKNNEK